MPARSKKVRDVAAEQFWAGWQQIAAHPLFRPLSHHAHVFRSEDSHLSTDAWAVVSRGGIIQVHPRRRAHPDEWVYVLAHCLLHLGFGHFRGERITREWNVACDYVVARFLDELKLGRRPADIAAPIPWPAHDEQRLHAQFMEEGIPPDLTGYGTGGASGIDMVTAVSTHSWWENQDVKWQKVFSAGLSAAVISAVNVAGGIESAISVPSHRMSTAHQARSWFISSYPLLGALAASFTVIDDPIVCVREDVSVAAVNPSSREIFINRAAGLTDEETRFVMAHELLHVGLRHDIRRQGRDPFLWNIACDYVINDWLIEMGVGDVPRIGILHDPGLKGESAESIYDRIITDMRRYRRLATLRGVGVTDIIERRTPDWWRCPDGMTLDEFYRSCLSQGLAYHQDQGRGYLPAALIEEIRALDQPPIPWDVELAKWFDEHFPPIEKERTYARPSRRQSSTPDIPRPRYVIPPRGLEGRTFGVVLDTSGSMDRDLLARALGAIASYSLSRDVPLARVIFCDAEAYDQGYMSPEDIAGRVKVKGRGGTVLQPGIALLENADDFPVDGPILIITDGYCEPRLRIRREHAYLLPKGHSLPFPPKGKTFRIE